MKNQIKHTARHAQNSLTELRIAIEQLANATDEHLFIEKWSDIASIIATVQFDLNDIREDKIKEFEG